MFQCYHRSQRGKDPVPVQVLSVCVLVRKADPCRAEGLSVTCLQVVLGAGS